MLTLDRLTTVSIMGCMKTTNRAARRIALASQTIAADGSWGRHEVELVSPSGRYSVRRTVWTWPERGGHGYDFGGREGGCGWVDGSRDFALLAAKRELAVAS